jgi:hypothetical protein
MNPLAQLVGASGVILVYAYIVAMIVFSSAFPFMAFSAVRNVARIRRALERIADASELPSRVGGSGILKL